MGYLKIMEQQLNKTSGSPTNLKGRTTVRHFWGKFYHKCCSHSPAGPKTYHAASWLTDLESKMGRKRLQKWFSCRDTASCCPSCNLWAGCWHLERQAGRHGDRWLQHHGGRAGFSTTASASGAGRAEPPRCARRSRYCAARRDVTWRDRAWSGDKCSPFVCRKHDCSDT